MRSKCKRVLICVVTFVLVSSKSKLFAVHVVLVSSSCQQGVRGEMNESERHSHVQMFVVKCFGVVDERHLVHGWRAPFNSPSSC